MEIRDHIAERDTELYIEAERESFKAAYPDVKITEQKEEYFLVAATHRYTHRDHHAFTLQDDNQPIGMIGIHTKVKAPKPTCYVTNIYIQSQYRGSDAIRLLMETVEKYGAEVGVETISLDVSVQNNRALSAYINLGFSITHHSMMKVL